MDRSPLPARAPLASTGHLSVVPDAPTADDDAAVPVASATVAEPDRERLVTENLPLVGHITREVVSRLPSHVDRSDLVSAGSLALTLAARTWDPERGVPFSRYAAIRIRGAVTDELRSMDWASRGVRSKARAIAEARSSLHSSLGRPPAVDEIAARSGLSAAEVEATAADLERASVLSLHTPAGADRAAGLVSDVPRPDEVLERRESLGYVRDAVAELPERLQTVVHGYFLQGRPMAELAAELGVTESRISQLRAEAVSLLRAALHEPLHQTPEKQTRTFGPRVLAARQAYVAAVGARSSAVDRLRHTTAFGDLVGHDTRNAG